MFGLKERLGSTKVGVFKAFNIIRAVGIKSVNASSDPKEEPTPLKRVEAFIIESKHTNEVETQKAMVIFLSRHERWKAGGPV